ncbi:hypothetical protein Syun_025619 [Stephania yunnanensis]|uniref:Uncharacterized protein n=1 Tax=Stephania yunnanensis TaxID=152371 RepID=A0AAP0F0W5_9MAGN
MKEGGRGHGTSVEEGRRLFKEGRVERDIAEGGRRRGRVGFEGDATVLTRGGEGGEEVVGAPEHGAAGAEEGAARAEAFIRSSDRGEGKKQRQWQRRKEKRQVTTEEDQWRRGRSGGGGSSGGQRSNRGEGGG